MSVAQTAKTVGRTNFLSISVGFEKQECLLFTDQESLEPVYITGASEPERIFKIVNFLFDTFKLQKFDAQTKNRSIIVHFQYDRKMYELDLRFLLEDLSERSLALINFSEDQIMLITHVISEKVMVVLSDLGHHLRILEDNRKPDHAILISDGEKQATVLCFFHHLFAFGL